MAFTVPTVVVSQNSGGSVTSTAGTFSSAVAAGTPLSVGIIFNNDATTISSVVDSKGNTYTLAGSNTTVAARHLFVYKCIAVTTPLTTSDTLTVTIGAAAVINILAVAGPGCLFVPQQFTSGSVTPAAAALDVTVPALPTAANGYMVAFSVNGSAAPTWTTPGPVSLGSVAGGGSPFLAAAYEDVQDFPAVLEIAMSPTSTAAMCVTAFMSEYTDLYASSYNSLYGQFLGTSWPQSGALELEVDLLLNGTWTDITPYVYQRDGSVNISVTFGQPDEASKLVTAKCQLQLNNRGGTFTSRNTASPFYPFIGRNTQIRVLVPAAYNSTDAGLAYAFSGEVPAWPKSRDTSGQDVWCDIAAYGIGRRLTQAASLGSALKRFYLQKDTSDPTCPIAYWPMEDGASSTTLAEVTGNGSAMQTVNGTPTLASDDSFGGSDPIPVVNGATIFGLTGTFGDPGSITYTAPGTYTFVPRAGLTSLTSAECWGGGGGGTNGYQANAGKDAGGGGGEYAKETTVAITAGNSYTVTVGAGGQGGALTSGAGLKQKQGTDGSTSSFPGDAVTVVAHGGKAGTFTGARAGAGGTGSTNTTHFNGGAGGKNSGAFFGGSGGGSSAGTAANGNAGSNGGASNTGAAGGSAPAGGGAGGKGGNGGPSTDQGGTTGAAPGGGGGSGGENSGNSAAHSGGNGGAGKVKLTWTPLAAPAYNVTRFLCHIPATGDTNNGIVARVWSSGKVNRLELVYTTASNGTLTLQGKDSGGATLFTSGLPATGVNGVPNFISIELTPGATIGFALRVMPANNPTSAYQTSGTASASGSVGAVSEVDFNPNHDLTGTAIGHALVQYSFESLGALTGGGNAGLGPVSGWNQERIGHRFVRLMNEEGIAYQLLGDVSSGPSTGAQMGPQPDDKLINVLQQIPDLDGGLLYEPVSLFGLAYRARASMVAQKPKVIADYSLGQVSPPFAPTEDDQLLRNIVTAQRIGGSSVTVRDTTSASSSLPPPAGVGEYPVTAPVNAYADSQLAGIASRILTLGTVDDDRYPAVNFQLSRAVVAELYAQIVAMIPGDYLRIINGPADLTSSNINQLAFGFAWTLAAFQFDVQLNCVPEAPFET